MDWYIILTPNLTGTQALTLASNHLYAPSGRDRGFHLREKITKITAPLIHYIPFKQLFVYT